MKISISHLGSQVTQASLECIFETYGQVEQSFIFEQAAAHNGKPCRCAHIVMPDKNAAARAVRLLDGCFVNGLQMRVSLH